jgi:hypothetical protein
MTDAEAVHEALEGYDGPRPEREWPELIFLARELLLQKDLAQRFSASLDQSEAGCVRLAGVVDALLAARDVKL